jgi:3-(3-hydroxy-phenyl)propionate hydroxylase
MVSVSGRPARLRTLLGERFTGLLFETDPDRAGRFAVRALAGAGAVPVRLHVVLPAGTAAGTVAGTAAPIVHDEGPDLRAAYGARRPTWILVRPDGHVAAAGDAGDAGGDDAFRAALRRCSLAATEPDAARDAGPLSVEAEGARP